MLLKPVTVVTPWGFYQPRKLIINTLIDSQFDSGRDRAHILIRFLSNNTKLLTNSKEVREKVLVFLFYSL